MNPSHLTAVWLNECARAAHLWSKWCDSLALALWGM